MKDNLKMDVPREKGNYFSIFEIDMKENLKMINQMGKEFFILKMEELKNNFIKKIN